MSVIDYVDKILVWDTGSEDATVKIIKEIMKIKKDKILFKKFGRINKEEFPQLRQKMLEETKADCILTLDGDEVWWEDSITKLIQLISNSVNQYESVVVKTINCVGDIYHYQGEDAARYEFLGKRGHFNLRAFSTSIPGLHAKGKHGKQGYFDESEIPIQDRGEDKILLLPVSYMHMTHLQRSGNRALDKKVPLRAGKAKEEVGIEFPRDFYYPEVFFRQRPDLVPSPWEVMNSSFRLKAFFKTPLRKIHRRAFMKYKKHGY